MLYNNCEKEKGLTPKALLLLNNVPAHPDESALVRSDKAIKAMFLPLNTTPMIQPMDQGVLEAFKRRSMLQKLLLEEQTGQSIIESVKKIDFNICMSADAWSDQP